MRDIQNLLLFFVSIDNTRLIFLFLSLMLPKGVIFKIYLGQVTAQLKIYSGPLTSSLKNKVFYKGYFQKVFQDEICTK